MRRKRRTQDPNSLNSGFQFMEQLEESLPPFASTREEIRHAVERNSIQRGIFLLNALMQSDYESLIQQIHEIAQSYDKEVWYEQADSLKIKSNALNKLDDLSSPIPYPYYFCTPDILARHPKLVRYYRNVAMISHKVMAGMDMNTLSYEQGSKLTYEFATTLAIYFNQIISEILIRNYISPNRHIEMFYANIGDSLGGAWRNEIGRLAYVEVVTPLVFYLRQRGYLSYIKYSLKGKFIHPEEETEQGLEKQNQANLTSKKPITLLVSSTPNLEDVIEQLTQQRIVYRELGLSNGRSLLFNRQVEWKFVENGQNKRTKIGPDLLSVDDVSNDLWAGELKGGADPAGSDEHWKTATRAFDRIIDACKKTARPNPKLSFIATILVDRVAREAYQWMQDGKLASVYNLTQLADNPQKQQNFLEDVVRFLGYK